MLVFVSATKKWKPALREDKREAWAEVAAPLCGAARDQMKGGQLIGHHIGSGGASAECTALVRGRNADAEDRTHICTCAG